MVYVSVVPFAPLFVLGEIDTLTLLAIVACPVQLDDALTVLSVLEVAVTLILSIVPPVAFDGTVTLNVAFSLLPGDRVSNVGDMLRDQLELALSVDVNEKLSETPPVLVTVTV
jgi:hypothetical protein